MTERSTSTTRSTRRRLLAVGATALVAAIALTGCSSGGSDALSKQYGSGTTQNYISGDGAVTEVAQDKRTDTVDFDAKTMDGDDVTAKSLRGRVVVLNFWYASCPPCRAEAKYLNEVHAKYTDDQVQFIGVNVRDQKATAEAFERTFKVDYPTVLDADSGTMQLALSGQIAPNAVPATIVLDKQGRVAARVLGAVDSTSILDTLVSDELTGSGKAS
ncbi:TlpA disulfide reductase family protein [Curtobacterium sp. 9128]|uniref:TlpA family protein disulfide reductase n=1 Tax=Curtobacterium sp. 9128 TaxID=1793722 RepID=UPI00119FFFFE|nr:TlpA disulfide reductase family protein [Curtobacterium sp. 9128]